MTAIDDFGAGYAGLGLLVEFQPDLIKIDMKLIRGIDTSLARQAVVSGIVGICARARHHRPGGRHRDLKRKFLVLKAAGITLFQGYYFARPSFERLPRMEGGHVPGLRLTA